MVLPFLSLFTCLNTKITCRIGRLFLFVVIIFYNGLVIFPIKLKCIGEIQNGLWVFEIGFKGFCIPDLLVPIIIDFAIRFGNKENKFSLLGLILFFGICFLVKGG